jgi:hypothetical protein
MAKTTEPFPYGENVVLAAINALRTATSTAQTAIILAGTPPKGKSSRQWSRTKERAMRVQQVRAAQQDVARAADEVNVNIARWLTQNDA